MTIDLTICFKNLARAAFSSLNSVLLEHYNFDTGFSLVVGSVYYFTFQRFEWLSNLQMYYIEIIEYLFSVCQNLAATQKAAANAFNNPGNLLFEH